MTERGAYITLIIMAIAVSGALYYIFKTSKKIGFTNKKKVNGKR
jgi:hypothetical protein